MLKASKEDMFDNPQLYFAINNFRSKYWENPRYTVIYDEDGIPDFARYLDFAEMNNIKGLNDVKPLLEDDECISLFGKLLEIHFLKQMAEKMVDSFHKTEISYENILAILRYANRHIRMKSFEKECNLRN